MQLMNLLSSKENNNLACLMFHLEAGEEAEIDNVVEFEDFIFEQEMRAEFESNQMVDTQNETCDDLPF